MDFLDFIPTQVFEVIGVGAGLTGCAVITIQLLKEIRLKQPSSMALGFVLGWLFIYLFWVLYGIRFKTLALWLTNGIAVLLQLAVVIVVLKKRAIAKQKGEY